MSRRADSQRALLAVLKAELGRDDLVGTARKPWASATFSGTRHRIELTVPDAEAAREADRLARRLPGIEFRLPGHLVADIGPVERIPNGDGMTLAIEVLTIEAD